MMYALAFVASFTFIFLKAFQQLNVVHKQYLLVMPTSMLMSACEIGIDRPGGRQGWGWLVVFTGAGGGIGCVAAMYLHKFTNKKVLP
jgi:hypothetical protein